MQVLEILYKNELVVEANGPNISIRPDTAVFDTTDLSEERVVSEVEPS